MQCQDANYSALRTALKERNWGDLEGCAIEQQLAYEITRPMVILGKNFETRVQHVKPLFK